MATSTVHLAEELRAAAALRRARDSTDDLVPTYWEQVADWFSAEWHDPACRFCQSDLADARAYVKGVHES